MKSSYEKACLAREKKTKNGLNPTHELKNDLLLNLGLSSKKEIEETSISKLGDLFMKATVALVGAMGAGIALSSALT